MIQDSVLILTLVVMAILTGVFIAVALNAGKEAVDYAPVQSKAFGVRRWLFWLLLLGGVLTTVITTQDLPYAATRGQTADADVVIDVNGRQWFWEMSATEVSAGDTVLFNLTASDVNHGFGVYDPNMVMLGQTQAMPGYTNSLKLTLTEPGAYRLLCLEYCGLAHHGMIGELTVNAPRED